MRIDTLDHLAVEFQHEAQHAMRRGMLRPEVDREVAKALVGHGLALHELLQRHFAVHDFAFSSPGSGGPSHGLRKSNSRNSWARRTGS